jgi:hypothetical protein
MPKAERCGAMVMGVVAPRMGFSPSDVGSLVAFAVLALLAAEAQTDQEMRLCSRTMAF